MLAKALHQTMIRWYENEPYHRPKYWHNDLNIELNEEEITRVPWESARPFVGGRLENGQLSSILLQFAATDLSARLTGIKDVVMQHCERHMIAACMGQHGRLGEQSLLRMLGPEIAQRIIQDAFLH